MSDFNILIARLRDPKEREMFLEDDLHWLVVWREWENIGGFWRRHKATGKHEQYASMPALHYLTSLDAALMLVPEHFSYELTYSAAGHGAMHRARLWDCRRGPLMFNPENEWNAEADTLARAVCIASLMARNSDCVY